jgi:P27 family predicted phage terminase small subunit
MRVPEWLSDEARRIWRRVLRQTTEVELLNNLSSDMLAIYCDALVKYRQASTGLVITNDDGEEVARDEAIKAVQAWARLIAQYADKLGFTPVGQARLVKKKADEILDEFSSEFD